MSISSLLRRYRRTLHVYGDESGSLDHGYYFGLGLILTRDPGRHEVQMHNLRIKHGYRNELKYSSNDQHKLPYAKAVLDYFWSEPDLRFSGIVIDTSQHDLGFFDRQKGRGPRPRDVAYAYRYRQLILRSTPQRDELVLILDDRTRANEDKLPEYLNANIPNLKSLQLVDSAKHQLVQMADLVIGSIYGDCTDVRSRVKREIISHLKSAAGVDSLTASSLKTSQKLGVDVWRPPRDSQES